MRPVIIYSSADLFKSQLEMQTRADRSSAADRLTPIPGRLSAAWSHLNTPF